MQILFHLGHPAHFHLFKHVIYRLHKNDVKTHLLIKEKDVLKKLLVHSGLEYLNILPEGKSSGKTGMLKDLVKRGSRMIRYCKEHKPDLLIGTSADISYVGKFLKIPAVNVEEDDAAVIPLHAWAAYPWAASILSPACCDNGRWSKKTVTYEGYHELAYLHPDHFTPDKKITGQYTDPDQPYFLLRFARLSAHHDEGVRGIHDTLALELIEKIQPYGKVIITSERKMSQELESYRMAINPVDIHHLLAFAKIVIGDSQTMSAEAAVLGTPYIRFNDFVGKIGYLKELEEKYKLGYGITPDNPEAMLSKAETLASAANTPQLFQKRKEKMLSEKINVADFIYEYIVRFLHKE